MSTPAPELPRWQRRNLSPMRSLFIIALLAGSIAGMAWYYMEIWDILVEFVPAAVETVQEMLESAFMLVGMPPAIAQIATAYVALVLFLIVLYIVVRKWMSWRRGISECIEDHKQMYADTVRYWSGHVQERFLAWWNTLDWLAKIAAVVGIVLVLIPLFVLLSVGLGMLVTMLL